MDDILKVQKGKKKKNTHFKQQFCVQQKYPSKVKENLNFPGATGDKNAPATAGDTGPVPGPG